MMSVVLFKPQRHEAAACGCFDQGTHNCRLDLRRGTVNPEVCPVPRNQAGIYAKTNYTFKPKAIPNRWPIARPGIRLLSLWFQLLVLPGREHNRMRTWSRGRGVGHGNTHREYTHSPESASACTLRPALSRGG